MPCSRFFIGDEMVNVREERLAFINALLSNKECITSPAALCETLELAGAASCAVLLKRATILMANGGEWERCHEVALKSREYAWEQLHR